MHYSWELNVLSSNTIDNPASVQLKIGSGIIRRFKLVFPSGCSLYVRSLILDGSEQILPTNLGGYYALDGDSVEGDVYYDLNVKYANLTWYAWNTGANYPHTLILMMDLQGNDELTLEGVMNRLAFGVETLIAWLKTVF